MRVGDAEVDAVRRALAGHLAVGAGLLERERLAEVGVERGLALCSGLRAVGCLGVAVRLEVLGVGGPVAALPDRGERTLQGRLVLGEEFGCRCHAGDTNAAGGCTVLPGWRVW